MHCIIPSRASTRPYVLLQGLTPSYRNTELLTALIIIDTELLTALIIIDTELLTALIIIDTELLTALIIIDTELIIIDTELLTALIIINTELPYCKHRYYRPVTRYGSILSMLQARINTELPYCKQGLTLSYLTASKD